ncbi:hypothetical protein F5878DRAFT_666099 [Lentinula raphanica]|uniref:KN homeodomain domain-containing protein n=1 Tax=Lentinula raphanica TaxID=153919 RepID=A0AA38NYM2_9AGAR|nr:hypothetical protein F5878DRAFT_666099 [Lentinula raphanica]
MVANAILDDRLVSSIDHLLDGLHLSDMNDFLHDWNIINKEVIDGHAQGSLDYNTSSLAVGVSDCMQILCDTFINLKSLTDGHVNQLGHDLDALLPPPPSSSNPPPSPSHSRTPSSTNTLPPHILPCHTWLLSNLHNPYPSLPTRDSIASSTNTDRRIIDSWFVDVRRRIGWTALVESGRERDSKRRKASWGLSGTSGMGRSGLKYRSRNELISAASQFFLPSSSSSSSSSSSAHHSNHTTLTPLEIQTFSALQNAAHALYKDKGLSMKKEGSPEISQSPKSNNKKRRGSSSSATTATSIKQEESSSDVEEDDDVEHGNGARRYKRSRFSPRSVSPAESSITTSSESYVTTPTDGSFPFHTPYAKSNTFSNTSSSFSFSSASSPTPSSSPSQAPSLKRKRAVSSFDEYPSTPTPTSSSFSSFSSSTFSTSPVSPATKRLRTALNGAGVLRSVSDPTPVPLFASTPGSGSGSGSGLGNSGFTQPLTFDGFSASALDAWFSGIGTAAGTGSVESGKDVSGEWIDPFFFGLPDPVVHQTQPEAPTQNQTQTQAEAASSSSVPLSTSVPVPVPSTIPPPIVPYPLDINVNVNVNIGDLSSYSSSYSYSSPSSSSPSTPALSASGTLTDDTDTDTDTEGDDDERDSLFGDNDHDRDREEDHAPAESRAVPKPKSKPTPTPTPGDILNNFHATATANAKPNTNAGDFSTDFPPAFPLNDNIDLTSFPELSNFPDLTQFPDFSEFKLFNIDGLPGIGDLDRSKAAASNVNLPHLRQQHGDLQEGHLPLPGLNLSLDDTGDLGNTHTHTDTRDIHSSRVGSGTGNGIEDGREKEDKVGTHADVNSNSNSNSNPISISNSDSGLGRDLGTVPGYGYEPRYGFGFGFGFGFENEPVPLVLDGFGLGSENQFGLGGVGELGDSGLDLGELSELGGGVNVVAGNLGSLGSLWAGPTPTRETFGMGVGVASLV